MVDVNISVDEERIPEEIQKRLKEAIEATDKEMVFWDNKELMRRTCMSWNTMQEHFFFDERCPKVKIESKWYFPAEEMKQFLLTWMKEKR
ncbi:group-specific protein [Salimicrobium halophilum]|uniref:Group-specific protein n=1 Tax=Salimicrobium halophilum TaxID=86666 RepID=A0A1G8VJE1_9BACI|nr:group-specific protein [Salimicrobium halophilum]SDJ66113.1 hypothetical protein SAMN04490247_2739 [Salimicrobium halophilum]